MRRLLWKSGHDLLAAKAPQEEWTRRGRELARKFLARNS
jgi:hypothetical protein